MSDAYLTELIGAGRDEDGAAIAELYARYHPLASRFAARLTGGESVSEDIATEALIRTWRRLEAGHHIESFRRYLFTAVRNLYLDHLRQRARHTSMELVGESELPELAASARPDGMVEFADLSCAMETLPGRYRHVLWLTAVEGCAVAEVADQLAITYGTAAVLAHRARRALASAYAEQRERWLAS